MKIHLDDGDRLVLSGPPGGVGAVVLLLVVGTAMSGGGGLFLRMGLTHGALMMIIMGGLAGAVGLAILVGGIGTALTRDRLELDSVTGRGRWTRQLLGRPLKKPVEFALEHAKHVTVKQFVETSPRTNSGGSSSVEKVRARLLITKPRRAIVLDEAERPRMPRVQAVAEAVAARLGLEVEVSDDRE
ncbi:MAG: hypothetical protein ACYTGC_12330 [Planctomycetota bacterium]|jgi:hypothetical protein